MATVRARKQSDGPTRSTAIVRIRKGKTIIHQEYKTFAHRTAAVTGDLTKLAFGQVWPAGSDRRFTH
jgi:hypothetical protein